MQAQDATTDLKVFLLPRAAVVLKWLCPLFESTISSLVFNCAACGGVLLEVVCQSESCSESTAFSLQVAILTPSACGMHNWLLLQGVLVFLLGLDTLICSIFSFISSRPVAQDLRKHKVYSHVGVYMWLLPLVWILLATSCCYSHTYYETNGLGRVKHYAYPILIILRNQQSWRSLVAFLYGIGQALSVLLLFFSFVLGISAIVMLFLQGLYNSGDFTVDNQFSDYMEAFTTMFYYVLSGECRAVSYEAWVYSNKMLGVR